MNTKAPTFLLPRNTGDLCELCKRIVAPTGGSFTLAYPEKTLKTSAARGCTLCRLLFADLVHSTFRTSVGPADLEVTNHESRLRVLDFNNVVHAYEIVSHGSKWNDGSHINCLLSCPKQHLTDKFNLTPILSPVGLL
jgi:hypothetical protein